MTLTALVPLDELPSVRAALARVRAKAPHQGLPDLGPRTRDRVYEVVAAIAPRLAPERLALLVRYALWSVALDDRVDAPPATTGPPPATGPATADPLVAGVAALAAGRRPAPADPLLTSLAGILDELSRYDPTGAARARCAQTLRDAVADGVDHRRLGLAVAAGHREPPTAEEYLAVAASTVNYLSFAYALLAVAGARLDRRQVERIEPALRHGAYAVRLGNDLRSVARDRAAGALNVLDLRTADGAAVTTRWVRREITRHARAHRYALARLRGRPAVARALTRSLRVSLALYQLADLR